VTDEERRDRRDAIGTFNLAASFHAAGISLSETPSPQFLRATFPSNVEGFLFIHSVELYPKAFLAAAGIGAAELRTRHGHRLGSLAAHATNKGLALPRKDMDAIERWSPLTMAVAERYHESGFRTVAEPSRLKEVAMRLHLAVRAAAPFTILERGYRSDG